MPRFATGRTKVSTAEKIRRSRSYRVRGFTRWIDPFPMVHGTLPEKMVYQALSRRGLPFFFLGNVHVNIPELDLFKTYQADFLIPSLRLIIEVQGAHWHSTDSAIESDALKFAMYQQAGYKVVAWWDYEIFRDINALFRTEPLLASFAGDQSASSELSPVDRTKVDTSKGIRTLNRRRASRLLYRKKSVRLRF